MMTRIEKKHLYNMNAKKAISVLEKLPKEDMDFELIGILARAYNNDDQEQKAKDLLLTVRVEGEKDSLWNYRMGYSCFYLGEYEEALPYLETAQKMGGEWDALLAQCKEHLNPPAPAAVDEDFVNEMVEYLNCPCTIFNPMKDEKPIMKAFQEACDLGEAEGFVPMLIAANDPTLWECLLLNVSDDGNDDSFELNNVIDYRKNMIGKPIADGKETLCELLQERKEEAEDDDMDWDEEIIGKVENGEEQREFLAIWDYKTDYTIPLILAKIPVKHPWEVFAFLPFGGWNECPDTTSLMATAKYWYEKHHAIPAVITHDQLEFRLEKPVSNESALELALEQYGFCPDVVDQGVEDGTVGMLASALSKSTVWYFWWD